MDIMKKFKKWVAIDGIPLV